MTIGFRLASREAVDTIAGQLETDPVADLDGLERPGTFLKRPPGQRNAELAIHELVDGTLGPVRRAELQTHLDVCAECRALVADLNKIRAIDVHVHITEGGGEGAAGSGAVSPSSSSSGRSSARTQTVTSPDPAAI